MTKAIIIARFSPQRDASRCESNATQVAGCQEYCEAKGYGVAGVYEDVAISGADEDRPGLWAAIDALKRRFVLVALKGDRLARDVFLSEFVYREVRKKGARVEIVDSTHNSDSPDDVMMRQLISVFAERERKIIAARTSLAMKYHQSQGLLMGNEPPYGTMRGPDRVTDNKDGTKRTRKTIVDNPAEMLVVERVLAEHAAGKNSRQIARGLIADGVQPRGATWEHGTIVRIIRRYGPEAV